MLQALRKTDLTKLLSSHPATVLLDVFLNELKTQNDLHMNAIAVLLKTAKTWKNHDVLQQANEWINYGISKHCATIQHFEKKL